MALFWLSSALGILGFAALMLAILLGELPESYPNCDRKPRRRHSFFSRRAGIDLPVSKKNEGCLTSESVVLTRCPGRQEARFLGGVVQPTGHGSWG